MIAKDTTLFGNHVGQIRFEILNLTNTVKFRGDRLQPGRLDQASAQITQQAGFMRIWQLSFRYTF